ncbi:Nif3-like dinuclear metal center hexameric protein [Alteromonas sp. 345S023]|uniref:GTP cyclohydrolase 1 type 2 homolog n=1 Tax=Alteromonas profundi TaxID=2696062 RepID=A0A7X5RM51_9ALTE|nr:Nif3-like dinuclear metal center hexameric protein [Alteromonas profundi]
MPVTIQQLTQYLDGTLRVQEISDYCPNGLQVEGQAEVNRIVTGVTASQALIDAAIDARADAILVHHGYFWKGESQPITGMKKRRIASLLHNDISLLAYHLPLDVHPEYGNNRQLAKLLGIEHVKALSQVKPVGVVMEGEFAAPISGAKLQQQLANKLARDVLMECPQDKIIKRVAWCTGGGQGFIEQAVNAGVDAFITGEVSEQTIHTAREMEVGFFAAGHHATERYGVKALGEHLQGEFDLDVRFIDIPNPA